MLKFGFIIVCILASALSAIAESRIYFHWGSYTSNKELLEASGYEFGPQAHDRELSTTRPGELNPAVLKKTYAWFFEANQADAAGPGLYVSSVPHDSSSFGPDLLVAEIVSPPKDFLPSRGFIPTGYDYKNFYKDGQMLGAPYIVKYAPTWHVFARPPKIL